MDNNTILLVDDDKHILQILELYLRKEGYTVVTCERGDVCLEAFRKAKPALVLLDVMLPGKDGWSVLKLIRAESEVPVIMLTAKGDISDRVQGLDCGADDYIVKPFEAKELIARIKAVLRRATLAPEDVKAITIGELEISMDNYLVINNGKKVEMPPKEIELLHFLATHPGKVYTREQLLDNVWGFGFFGDSRTVDVHIKRVRDRLGESPAWAISTVWGVGYKFDIMRDGN